jgi:hypothetical protein
MGRQHENKVWEYNLLRWKENKTGSGSCQMAGFGVSGGKLSAFFLPQC